jgi:hypothetical protein
LKRLYRGINLWFEMRAISSIGGVVGPVDLRLTASDLSPLLRKSFGEKKDRRDEGYF